MSRTWKIVLLVITVFAVLLTIAFFWAKSAWDKIGFGKPRILGLNLSGISATDLANIVFTGAEKEVTATLEMDVVNQNNFSIPFSNLKVKLFYNNLAIAETSNLLEGKQAIPANGTFTATDTVKILLNNAGIQMITDKITNGKVMLEYKIMVKVFGIPLPKSLQSNTLDI